MKTFRFAVVISSAALIFSLTSCNKDDDKKFDVVLEHTFKVSIDYADTAVTWSTAELLDAASSSADFDQYKNGIKSISVSKVSFVVQNVTTPDVKFTKATISYSKRSETDYDHVSQTASLDLDNVNLKAAEGHETTLQFGDATKLEIASFLKTDKEINVYLNGVMPATPGKFEIVMRISASVVAASL